MNPIYNNNLPDSLYPLNQYEKSQDGLFTKVGKFAIKTILTTTVLPPLAVGTYKLLSKHDSSLAIRIMKTATLIWPFIVGVNAIWSESSTKQANTKNHTPNTVHQRRPNRNEPHKLSKYSNDQLKTLLSDRKKVQNLDGKQLNYLFTSRFRSDKVKKQQILTTMTNSQCNDYIKFLQGKDYFLNKDLKLIAKLFARGDNKKNKNDLFKILGRYDKHLLIKHLPSLDFLEKSVFKDLMKCPIYSDINKMYSMISDEQKSILAQMCLDKEIDMTALNRDILLDLLTTNANKELREGIILKVLKLRVDTPSYLAPFSVTDLIYDSKVLDGMSNEEIRRIISRATSTEPDSSIRIYKRILRSLSGEQITGIRTTEQSFIEAMRNYPEKVQYLSYPSVYAYVVLFGMDAQFFCYLSQDQISQIPLNSITFKEKGWGGIYTEISADEWFDSIPSGMREKVFFADDSKLVGFYGRLNDRSDLFINIFSSIDEERCRRLFSDAFDETATPSEPDTPAEIDPKDVIQPSDNPEDKTCQICMDAKFEVVPADCAHPYCETCLDRLIGLGLDCAICRGPINGMRRIKVLDSSPITVAPVAA